MSDIGDGDVGSMVATTGYTARIEIEGSLHSRHERYRSPQGPANQDLMVAMRMQALGESVIT